jgi:hypothetical protein
LWWLRSPTRHTISLAITRVGVLANAVNSSSATSASEISAGVAAGEGERAEMLAKIAQALVE